MATEFVEGKIREFESRLEEMRPYYEEYLEIEQIIKSLRSLQGTIADRVRESAIRLPERREPRSRPTELRSTTARPRRTTSNEGSSNPSAEKMKQYWSKRRDEKYAGIQEALEHRGIHTFGTKELRDVLELPESGAAKTVQRGLEYGYLKQVGEERSAIGGQPRYLYEFVRRTV